MKRIKLYEEFINSPQEAPTKPKTAPDTKPGKPSVKPGPSRPSPLRVPAPNINPAPKATTDDVIDRYADELDNLSEEEKEEYFEMLAKKYKRD